MGRVLLTRLHEGSEPLRGPWKDAAGVRLLSNASEESRQGFGAWGLGLRARQFCASGAGDLPRQKKGSLQAYSGPCRIQAAFPAWEQKLQKAIMRVSSVNSI